MGIKIHWTLANEENWNATHRFAGKVWFFGGLAFLLCAFLPAAIFIYALLAAVFILVMIPVVYSYRFYRLQIKNNTATKEDYKNAKASISTRVRVISIIAVIAITVSVTIIMFIGDISIDYAEDSFTVSATFWEKATIDYDKIDSVSYCESGTPGERINGWGSARLLLGWFDSEHTGSYTRYTYISCKSTVEIRIGEKLLVINGESEEATRAVYEKLVQKTEANEG